MANLAYTLTVLFCLVTPMFANIVHVAVPEQLKGPQSAFHNAMNKVARFQSVQQTASSGASGSSASAGASGSSGGSGAAAVTPSSGSAKLTCPVSKVLKSPAKPAKSLSLCTEFQASACCSAEEEAVLAKTFADVWTSISGHCPGCLQNHKKMLCNLYCSPEQSKFVKVEQRNADATQSLKKGVMRMCPNFCDRWWKSCTNTNLASKYKAGAASFCPSMIDTNSGIRVELNHFDCYMYEGPNTCEGSFKDNTAPVARASNVWFTVTCVTLGAIAVALFAMIVMKVGHNEAIPPAGYEPMGDDPSESAFRGDGHSDQGPSARA